MISGAVEPPDARNATHGRRAYRPPWDPNVQHPVRDLRCYNCDSAGSGVGIGGGGSGVKGNNAPATGVDHTVTSTSPAQPDAEGAGTRHLQRVDFHFDPVCPFAWITSRWMVQVAPLRDLDVHWRFISLRMVNADSPGAYRAMHEAGLRLLRVAVATRHEGGNDAVGAWYTAIGNALWQREAVAGEALLPGADDPDVVAAALEAAGLPAALVAALDNSGFDELIAAETREARDRAGEDVGTPIITFDAPDGPDFFGPVISRLSDDAGAVKLWDALEVLARFDSFTEVKRSLRQMPELPALRGFTA